MHTRFGSATLVIRSHLLTTASFFLGIANSCDSQTVSLALKGSQYTQSTGSTNFATVGCCSWGQYNLTGGALQCDTLQLGACGDGGTFYQTGGDFTVTSVMMPGWAHTVDQGYGRFSINGGTAHAATISVENRAACVQSAGILTI